jgi:hypothetical protein
MTLSIMTFGIVILSIKDLMAILRIMTLSITTLSIMPFSIIDLIATLSIMKLSMMTLTQHKRLNCDTQHIDTQYNDTWRKH